VPTHDQILVPETLLKKRKSQEKAREERTAELEKKKQVCYGFSYHEHPETLQ
jgi:large subunit ribosomal protein L7e